MKTKMFLIAAAVMFAAAQPAAASLITIDIEAVVDSVDDPDGWLEGKINPGDIITGSYTYESTTVDSSPLDPTVGHYWHYAPPAGISLSSSSFTFASDTSNLDFLVGILNDGTSGGLHDSYWICSYNNLPLSNSASVDEITWTLEDRTASALTSEALPITPPALEQWESGLGLRLHGERGDYIVDAHVTSAIPEPTTILFLVLGVFLLRKER